MAAGTTVTGPCALISSTPQTVAVRACVSVLGRLDVTLTAWPCRPMSRSAATVHEHGLSAFLSAPYAAGKKKPAVRRAPEIEIEVEHRGFEPRTPLPASHEQSSSTRLALDQNWAARTFTVPRHVALIVVHCWRSLNASLTTRVGVACQSRAHRLTFRCAHGEGSVAHPAFDNRWVLAVERLAVM